MRKHYNIGFCSKSVGLDELKTCLITDAPKSIEEEIEDDQATKEQSEQTESKRSFSEDSSINEEFTMPVLQSSASRDVDEVISQLARLSSNNKRYYGK